MPPASRPRVSGYSSSHSEAGGRKGSSDAGRCTQRGALEASLRGSRLGEHGIHTRSNPHARGILGYIYGAKIDTSAKYSRADDEAAQRLLRPHQLFRDPPRVRDGAEKVDLHRRGRLKRHLGRFLYIKDAWRSHRYACETAYMNAILQNATSH